MGPEISVIVRSIGRSTHLRDCLESLAAQSHRDFEVVLVDMTGGATSSVIEAVSPRLPSLLHTATGGRLLSRPIALNHGITRATGRYIAILDDDNCYATSHLAVLAKAIRHSSGADLVYSGVLRQTFTVDGVLLHEEKHFVDFDFVRLVRDNYIYSSTCVYPKESWRRIGGYDQRFPVYEDWDFLIRLTRSRKVTGISDCTAITRHFTGLRGVPQHFFREPDNCARCHAAILWKHRRLCRGELSKQFDGKATALLLSWFWRGLLSFATNNRM